MMSLASLIFQACLWHLPFSSSARLAGGGTLLLANRRVARSMVECECIVSSVDAENQC